MAKSYAIVHIDSHNPCNKPYDTPLVQLREFAYEGAFASSIKAEEEIPMEILCKFMRPIYKYKSNNYYPYKPNMDNNYYNMMVRKSNDGSILWDKIDINALINYYKEYFQNKYPSLRIQ